MAWGDIMFSFALALVHLGAQKMEDRVALVALHDLDAAAEPRLKVWNVILDKQQELLGNLPTLGMTVDRHRDATGIYQLGLERPSEDHPDPRVADVAKYSQGILQPFPEAPGQGDAVTVEAPWEFGREHDVVKESLEQENLICSHGFDRAIELQI
ncbi:hypothetical protein ACJZ2D_009163 [Fusarium nematophilum]